ncbi:MAG TPA: CxxxxCH/CxxCH domain-containing protein [Myxococcales bacterium]
MSTGSQRQHCWLGRLLDGQVPVGTHAVYLTTTLSASTITGVHLWAGTYQGVDQTTPVSSSAANNSAAVTVTFGTAVTYNASSMTVYAVVGGNTATAVAHVAGFASAGTSWSTDQSTSIAQVTNATSGTWANTSTVTWTGASARAAIAVASLNPSAVAAPTVTSPTAASVAATTATLGASVTSNGGAVLTARGTCWGTTATPTGNCVAEGGTTTGVFTHARTALTSGSLVYYRGYATNSAGTGYSTDGSFYTDPTTQASGVNFTAITTTGMIVNWTRGTGGDGVVVLMKQATAVSSDPVDGTYTTYTVNTAFGSGAQIGTGNYVVFKGVGTSVAVTGLTAGTAYHVAIYEYKGASDTSGANLGTNYLTAGVVGNAATTAVSAPTLTSPTATLVAATTATLGANITSNGGAAISARGTCWGATAAPSTNCAAEGGTATGVFTQARTGLTSGTLLYYRGYATNSAGTGYSTDGSFYTEPGAQASAVNFTAITSAGMTINWTRGTGGDGVLVLVKQATAVDSNPIDGVYTTYGANTVFGSGTQLGTGNYIVFKGSGTSVAITGLTGGTTYHVAVYEYKGTVDTSGVNLGTNYLVAGAVGNATTTAGASAVTVTNPGQAAAAGVTAGSSALAGMLRMVAGPASVKLTGLTLSNTGNAVPGYDLLTLQLFEDVNGNGLIDQGTDALLGNASWNGSKWAFTGLSWSVPTAARTLLVSASTTTGATTGRTFTMSVATADVSVESGATVNAFTTFSGNTLTVGAAGAPGGPVGAPMVLLLNPISGAALSGTFKVQVQAYDGGGIGSVTVQLSTDGGSTWGANLAANLNYSVGTNARVYETTLSLSAGSYTLVARASDGALTALTSRAVVLVGAAGRGDGHLLRRDDSTQLCLDCHAIQTHSSQSTSDKYGSWAVGCRDCHTPHATRNRSLVNEVIQTPNSGAKDVRFTKTTGVTSSAARVDATYVNLTANNDGPCQVCHTKTQGAGGIARFRNTGNADATHYVSPTQPCAGCHQHNKGFSSSCNACHNAPPAVGAHAVHDQVPEAKPSYSDMTAHATQTQYGFACGKCHSGTHLNAANAGTPADPLAAEVAFDGTSDPKNPAPAAYAAGTTLTSVEPDGRSFKYSNGTCTSVYCHSNASPAGGTLAYKSPTWTGGPLACNGCHDVGGAATTLSSAHKLHTGAYAYDCSRCHVATATAATTIADKRLHVDGAKEVGFDSSGVDNHLGTVGNSGVSTTCANTYCHSNGQDRTAPYVSGPSIAWGTTADPECDSCHGGNASATATTGAGPLTSRSHTKHVGATAGYLYPCGQCHNAVVATSNDRAILAGGYTLHDNGTANVSLGSGSWNGTGCSSNYCHGSGTPQWGVSVMDCGSCHSGNNALLGSHAKHYASATLVTGTSAAFGSSGTTYQYGCGYCHPSGAAFHAKGAVSGVQAAQIAFSGTLPSGQAVSGTFAAGGTSAGTDRTFGYTAGTCSSLYCHSNAAPLGGTQQYRPPTWGTTLACNGCHSTAARSDSAVLTDLSNAHGKHIQSTLGETGSYAYKCDQCHADTVVANPNAPWALADADLGNVANHVRGEHTLKFSSAFGGSINQSAGAYNNVAYTCASTYCHSLGTATAAPFAAPNTAVAWSATANCTTCHSGDASQASKIGTTNGSATHAAHVNNAAVIGANYWCGDCHQGVVAAGTNSPVTTQANHANGVKNVSIGNRGTFASTDTTSTCSATYCHSSGQAAPAYRTITWTSPAIGCNGCHGQSTTTGAPDYPDGATLADANSHPAHVSASADCEHCHSGFVTPAGTAIPAGTTHTNGSRDVAILAAYDSNAGASNYTQATKTCSAITCHGTGTPVWGDPTTATCLGCHGTAGTETESLGTVINGTAATINTTEWLYSGHGKTAGAYDVSLNPAAAFSTSPTAGKTECLFCHDGGVAHSDTANPFRLRGASDLTGATAAYDSLAAQNATCLNCHATGSLGVNNGGSIKNGTVKPDAAHDGAKHSAATLGGKFCWDCHDPHGDRPSNTNSGGNNIFMVRRSVRANTDGTFGYPLLAGDEKAVEFYNVTAVVASDTGDTGSVGKIAETATALGTQHKGVCQACHVGTSTPFTKYWEATGYDDLDGPGATANYRSGRATAPAGHNTSTYCVSCHPHAQKFKGGGCNGCHDYDTKSATYSGGVWTGGTWGVNYWDGTVHEGWGAHAKHINHLKTRLGITGTMDPNAATFGVGEAANVCGACHSNNEAANHATGGSTVRSINFGDGTFKYGGAAGFDFRLGATNPVYNGASGSSSSASPKSCSNVSCHYATTPVWNTY